MKQRILISGASIADFYFDALSQVRMTSWSTGRVTLVGDAAWCASPASGAGAELALVGAYRLAGELAAAAGDHHIAFPRYHNSHRALVAKKQQIGPNVRLMVPKTASGTWMRNTLARGPLLRTASTIERLLQPKTAPTLPEYAPVG